jgi:transcription antitermination factor NusG
MEQIAEKKNWYVLYTRSRCEKKVSELLSKRKIENYCPLNKRLRQWSDRKKMIMEPVFPSYVFVRVPSDKLSDVKKVTTDIVTVVYWLSRPAQIRNEEIEHIRLFLDEHTDIRIEKRPVCINEMVRILRGPFMNKEGVVQDLKNNRVVLSIPSLGYNMIAEVSVQQVELLHSSANASTEKGIRKFSNEYLTIV